jgi:hypothetical protein
MDWSVIAQLGKYLPWIMAEASRHPTVRDWVTTQMSAFPKDDYAQIVKDVQAQAANLPPVTDLASAVQYLPFIFSEMSKHPAMAAWVQQALSTMPAKDLAQIIGDAQLNAKQWST